MPFQPLLFSGFTLGGSSGGGGGGVSSVALSLPVSVFTVSGSPVTTSGTLTGSFNNQSGNTVFASPANGSSGAPTFRSLVSADLPLVSLTSKVSGILPIANGGTNSGTALTSNKVIISSAGSIIESATTTTQLSFLDATSSIQTQLNSKQASLGFTPEDSANKGIANGYAGLDGAGKVPYAQLPSALMTFRGAWNPTTNTPTLTNGVGLAGDTYRASVDGASTSPIVDNWFAGDFIIYNGTIWQRSPLADGVISVNGLTGAVTLTQGNLTDVGTDGITITGGTNAVWGSGTSISQHVADATHNGYLSSTDFVAFSSSSGAAISSLTGDGTATGPGAAAFTLATVNGNVGTFGSSSSVASFTVNGKGLITAASNIPISVTFSQVSGVVPSTQGGTGVNNSFNLTISGTSSINGTLTGTSSGTNTGDQTITLTGDVTGSGTGSFATTLTNTSVTGQPLTGFVSGPATAILATDTILQGLEKLQAQVSGGSVSSPGDIAETSFTAADNQVAPADITGFAFANGVVRSFDALVSIVRNNTYSSYKLNGIQKGASWDLTQSFVGDTTGITFSITAAGQLQYTSTSTGFTSLIKFRAYTTSV
jgi:hypothetical protein